MNTESPDNRTDNRTANETAPMARRLLPLLLALWTLFVWVGRLRNLVQEPGPLLDAGRWSLAGSVLFTVLGLALLATLVLDRLDRSRDADRSRDGDRPLAPRRSPTPTVVVALAGLTVVVWVVRAVDIAIGDHPAAFIAVHLVLAAVSITLAGLAALAVRARASGRLPSLRWVSL